VVGTNKNRLRLIVSTLAVWLISLNGNAETQIDDHNQQDLDSTAIIKTVRFYKENKHKQHIRLYPSKRKTANSGCHNFKRSRRIAKIVQIGYESCSVYTEKNCVADSIIRANHPDQDAYAEKLTEGHGWLPKPQSEKDKRGVKLRSWSCQ